MEFNEGSFKLKDGRKLGFVEFGDKNGFPILFFHGTPNSRISLHPNYSLLNNLNVRLISLERPGYGISDEQRDRKVIDWSYDIEEFIDHHEIYNFSVLGLSGGAPYALGCLFRLSDRVHKCGIVSGFAPLNNREHLTKEMSKSNKVGFWLAKHAPAILKAILKPVAKSSLNDPEKQLEKFIKGFALSDQNIVKQPEIREILLNDMKQAYRQGVNGHVEDLKAVVKPWGFSIDDIEKGVYIWQGEKDKNVPLAMGKYLEKRIPNSEMISYEKEGHLLYLEHIEEILTTLSDHKHHI